MSIERQIDSDGFNLAVAIDEPDTSPRTAVILCPGYLDSKDYSPFRALAEAVAAEGMLAARLDPVGTWASGGTEADYSISRYLRDVMNLQKYLTGTYDIRNMVVGGHSLGGLVSILHAARRSVQAVVALSPPQEMQGTAHPDWEQVGTRYTMRPLPSGTGVRPYQVPWSFVEDSSRPTYSALAAVKTPRYRNVSSFLLAGGQDYVVSVREVEGIFVAAQGPKRFEVIADMGHDYSAEPRHIGLVTSKVVGWLKAGGF